jgi:hypothetical protein
LNVCKTEVALIGEVSEGTVNDIDLFVRSEHIKRAIRTAAINHQDSTCPSEPVHHAPNVRRLVVGDY